RSGAGRRRPAPDRSGPPALHPDRRRDALLRHVGGGTPPHGQRSDAEGHDRSTRRRGGRAAPGRDAARRTAAEDGLKEGHVKLVTFTHAGTTRIGIADGDEIVDLSVAAPDLPRDMVAFLAGGGAAFEAPRSAA